jgi:hypothetical protein
MQASIQDAGCLLRHKAGKDMATLINGLSLLRKHLDETRPAIPSRTDYTIGDACDNMQAAVNHLSELMKSI